MAAKNGYRISSSGRLLDREDDISPKTSPGRRGLDLQAAQEGADLVLEGIRLEQLAAVTQEREKGRWWRTPR